LCSLVVARPHAGWQPLWDELVARGRGRVVEDDGRAWWCATETADDARRAIAGDDDAVATVLRGHLETAGITTVNALAETTALPVARLATGLAILEHEGFALQGRYTGTDAEWVARRLLARMHAYSRRSRRQGVEPASAQDLMRFLLRWQHVAPGTQRQGRAGVVTVVEQLQGFELPAGTWEQAVLPARLSGYRPEWLDHLCHSGELAWGRLKVRDEASDDGAVRTGTITSRATPVTLLLRSDLHWLLQAARGAAEPAEPTAGATRDVLDAMRQHGALFLTELAGAAGRLPAEVENALWDGVARGLMTADGFAAVRTLLAGRQTASHRQWQGRRGLRRGAGGHAASGGRWSLLPRAGVVEDRDALAEAVAEQLLARWGVVFRDLMSRETLAIPWRDVLWALRRMEARGTVRGGRFVTGFTGEQYALPEAVDQLRAVRRSPRNGEVVQVSATDPLNLVGILTPGPRIPAVRTNTVTYVDGLPTPVPSPALTETAPV
jgi:ATP-dependent Lhr-like helicase